jgi:hypothetical protein
MNVFYLSLYTKQDMKVRQLYNRRNLLQPKFNHAPFISVHYNHLESLTEPKVKALLMNGRFQSLLYTTRKRLSIPARVGRVTFKSVPWLKHLFCLPVRCFLSKCKSISLLRILNPKSVLSSPDIYIYESIRLTWYPDSVLNRKLQ